MLEIRGPTISSITNIAGSMATSIDNRSFTSALSTGITCRDIVGDGRVLKPGGVGLGGDLERGGVSEGEGVLESSSPEALGKMECLTQEASGPGKTESSNPEASVAAELVP